MSKYPKIVAFPDDEKTRIIWWYGPVFKNNSDSNIPKVLVLTRLLDENGALTDQNQHFNINVTELELVRIGSIWKGQKRQKGFHTNFETYTSNMQFSFDFSVHAPASIKFGDINPDTMSRFIPRETYELGGLKSDKQLTFQLLNSTLTHLIDTEGIKVLIPSMELLTSAIAPEHKLLRAHLLQHPVDQISADYMNNGYEKDGIYVIESRNGYFKSNLTLLAYMKNDLTSRARLSKIWTSMQADSSKYSDKYPIILPYHPTELTLKGDGIKINDNTFLMLRINGFSLPTDYPVHNIINEPAQDPEQYISHESEKNAPQPQNPRQKDDLPITSDNDPHREAGELYIRTEVKIIGPEPKIELFKKQKINNEPPKIIPLEKQEIEALSSGEKNYRKGSKRIASAKQAPIKQGEGLSNIKWAIKELNELVGDPQSDAIGFAYIANDGTEYTTPTFCYITESAMPQGHKRKWYLYDKSKEKNNEEENTKTNLRYRKFLIAKIALKENKTIYLLEIEQKGTEAFSGLLFSINGEMTHTGIEDLLVKITNNEGRFRKRVDGKLAPIDLPIGESLVFEHHTSSKITKHIDKISSI